jgi:hypothetical protein
MNVWSTVEVVYDEIVEDLVHCKNGIKFDSLWYMYLRVRWFALHILLNQMTAFVFTFCFVLLYL